MNAEVNDNRDEMLPGVDPDNLVAIARSVPNWKALQVPMVAIAASASKADEYGLFETQIKYEYKPAEEVGSIILDKPLYLVWLVDPTVVEAFLWHVVQTVMPERRAKYPPFRFEIVEGMGRTVMLKSSRPDIPGVPAFGENIHAKLALRLLGTGRVCEDFWISEKTGLLHARLKTREQQRIEDACIAFELDIIRDGEYLGEQTIGIESALLEATPTAPTDKKTEESELQKPAQGLKDLPLLIYRIVQNKSPIGVDEILDVAREKMRKSRKDAIKDRRRERAAKSLDTLIASGALNLSDDGAEVSL